MYWSGRLCSGAQAGYTNIDAEATDRLGKSDGSRKLDTALTTSYLQFLHFSILNAVEHSHHQLSKKMALPAAMSKTTANHDR